MMSSMEKKIIAVDADDTLFDENTAIRMFMNDTYGYEHTAADYDGVGPFINYWERIWNLDAKETNERYEEFVLSSYKENMQPIKDALEVVRALKQKYELVVVTSRHHRAAEMTHDSLSKHYPDIFSDIHFTSLWGGSEKATKAKICNEIGADYLIDDAFGHCVLAAEADVKTILFGDYGWNRNVVLAENMVRCITWKAVEKYFLSQ